MAAARQFALGALGGTLIGATQFQFSRTQLHHDFAYLSHRVLALSASLSAADPSTTHRSALPPTSSSTMRSHTDRLAPPPSLSASFADAWNALLAVSSRSLTGRY
ncbi:hypothetical protein BC828DRAFT_416092 [Blastocladiella britannica]|nr:hypothetical protein BC828DRAFT_416092 [Blastocladiella britannica]